MPKIIKNQALDKTFTLEGRLELARWFRVFLLFIAVASVVGAAYSPYSDLIVLGVGVILGGACALMIAPSLKIWSNVEQ